MGRFPLLNIMENLGMLLKLTKEFLVAICLFFRITFEASKPKEVIAEVIAMSNIAKKLPIRLVSPDVALKAIVIDGIAYLCDDKLYMEKGYYNKEHLWDTSNIVIPKLPGSDYYDKLGIKPSERVEYEAHIKETYAQNVARTKREYEFLEVTEGSRVFVVRDEKDMRLLASFSLMKANGNSFDDLALGAGDVYCPGDEPHASKLKRVFDVIIISPAYARSTVGKIGVFGEIKSRMYILNKTKATATIKTVDCSRAAREISRITELVKARVRKTASNYIFKFNLDDVVEDRNGNMVLNPKMTQEQMDLKIVSVGSSAFLDRYAIEYIYSTEIEGAGKSWHSKRLANTFILFESTSKKKLSEAMIEAKLLKIFNKGINLNVISNKYGVKLDGNFKYYVASPSQRKECTSILTCLDRKAMKSEMTYGLEWYGKRVLAATVDARVSLNNSATHIAISKEEMIDRGYKIKSIRTERVTVPATYYGLKITRNKNGDPVLQKVHHNAATDSITFDPCDGQSLMSFRVAADLAVGYGAISKAERDYAVNLFLLCGRGLDAFQKLVNNNERLEKIFNKVASGVQSRFMLSKGMLVIADIKNYFSSEYNDCDIILGDGMEKENVGKDENGYNLIKGDIRYIAYSKPSKPRRLNGQFISGLTITPQDLLGLAKEEFELLTGALSDGDKARKILNSMNIDADITALLETGAAGDLQLRSGQKASQLLAVDERMILSGPVQKVVRDLVTKKFEDMATGRIVDPNSSLNFIVTDPRWMSDLPEVRAKALKKDEAYLNGFVGERALFRNPQQYMGSQSIQNFVDDKELWYLKDILVVSPFSTVLARLNGADTDGDKVYSTNNPVILEAARKGAAMPFLYDEKFTVRKEDTPVYCDAEEMVRFMISHKRNQVGIISNYAEVYSDLLLCSSKYMPKIARLTYDETKGCYYSDFRVKLNSHLIELGNLVGRVIDSDKTGEETDVPDYLKIKQRPHYKLSFAEYGEYLIAEEKAKKTGKMPKRFAKYYRSTSPRAALYNACYKGYVEAIKQPSKAQVSYNASAGWTVGIDRSKLSWLYKEVGPILTSYNSEIREIMIWENAQVENAKDKEEVLNLQFYFEELDRTVRTKIDAVMEKYRSMLLLLTEDRLTLAKVVYDLTYTRKMSRIAKKNSENRLQGWSAPLALMPEETFILAFINGCGDRAIKVSTADDEVIVNNVGTLITTSEGIIGRSLKGVDPGVYPVITIGSDRYIRVTSRELREAGRKLTQYANDNKLERICRTVTLYGFDKFDTSVGEFKEACRDTKFTFDIIVEKNGTAYAFVGDKKYAVVRLGVSDKEDGEDENILTNALANAKVKVTAELKTMTTDTMVSLIAYAVEYLDVPEYVQPVEQVKVDFSDVVLNDEQLEECYGDLILDAIESIEDAESSESAEPEINITIGDEAPIDVVDTGDYDGFFDSNYLDDYNFQF